MNIKITEDFIDKIKKVVTDNPSLSIPKIAKEIEVHKTTLSRIINKQSKTMDQFAFARLDYFLQNHWMLTQHTNEFSEEQFLKLNPFADHHAITKVTENWSNKYYTMKLDYEEYKESADKLIKELKAENKKLKRLADGFDKLLNGYKNTNN